jgi:arginase family enzyme
VPILLGVPTALGSPRPDAAEAPGRLREDGIVERLAALGVEVRDLGDVAGLEPRWEAAPEGMRLRNIVAAVDQVKRVRGAVHAALVAHGPPLVLLGGDALVHLGAAAGVRDALGDDPGIVWLGSGTAFHTPETTPDGHLAGMALAALVGLGAAPLVDAAAGPVAAPSQVTVVGGDPSAAEAAAMTEAGVRAGAGAADSPVPDGPLYAAVDVSSLGPGGLGVDPLRQALLAAAVRERVAAVAIAELAPLPGAAVPVAALVAAALR